jgi:alpha-amylase
MKKRILSLLVIFLGIALIGCSVESLGEEKSAAPDTTSLQTLLYSGSSSDVILQGFHWNSHTTDWYVHLVSKAQDIKDAGFTIVWFPPPSQSVDSHGYLPGRLYNLDSNYGTQAQLQNAISALHPVKAIADIVINHRCGQYQIDGKWHGYYQPDWGNWAVVRNPGENDGGAGNWDTGETYGPAPDVDHTNPTVRSDLKAWMNWLKNTIGFAGWRYDMVKGYSGNYTAEYNDATAPHISIGEFWDYDRGALMGWLDSTSGKSTAFDFPTRNILYMAFQNGEFWRLRDGDGNPGGAIGWWPAKSVTFIENHDTEEARGGMYAPPFPSYNTPAAYAYILTHPGIPKVFWFDWVDFEGEINALIDIRKSQGITPTSSVDIQVADGSKYGAIIDDKVAVKIGWGDWSPGSGWDLTASGNNYAVWTKSDGPTPPPPGDWIRTVVYIHYESVPGEYIRIRGGHDGDLVPSQYPTRYEDIIYVNTLNSDTAQIKANDIRLDWGTQDPANGADGWDSALDWTCNAWPSGWGTKRTYAVDGYGEDPENVWGLHYWKFDVMMQGNVGDWFEFKSFIYNYQNSGNDVWEGNINQQGTPQQTINHWGRKGYITTVGFNQSWAEFTPLY